MGDCRAPSLSVVSRFCNGNAVIISVKMGLLNTKPEVRVEKEEANPTYQTYGRRGEVDYAVDYNGDYQPSDYDEMYDTVGGGSIQPKVETKTSQKSPKCCLFTVVVCVAMVLLGLVGVIFHLIHGPVVDVSSEDTIVFMTKGIGEPGILSSNEIYPLYSGCSLPPSYGS